MSDPAGNENRPEGSRPRVTRSLGGAPRSRQPTTAQAIGSTVTFRQLPAHCAHSRPSWRIVWSLVLEERDLVAAGEQPCRHGRGCRSASCVHGSDKKKFAACLKTGRRVHDMRARRSK